MSKVTGQQVAEPGSESSHVTGLRSFTTTHRAPLGYNDP